MCYCIGVVVIGLQKRQTGSGTGCGGGAEDDAVYESDERFIGYY